MGLRSQNNFYENDSDYVLDTASMKKFLILNTNVREIREYTARDLIIRLLERDHFHSRQLTLDSSSFNSSNHAKTSLMINQNEMASERVMQSVKDKKEWDQGIVNRWTRKPFNIKIHSFRFSF